jgi:hypothetical protein
MEAERLLRDAGYSHAGTHRFTDELFGLCPSCGQRLKAVEAWLHVRRKVVDGVICAAPGPTKVLMRPCGCIVDRYEVRQVTQIIDVDEAAQRKLVQSTGTMKSKGQQGTGPGRSEDGQAALGPG